MPAGAHVAGRGPRDPEDRLGRPLLGFPIRGTRVRVALRDGRVWEGIVDNHSQALYTYDVVMVILDRGLTRLIPGKSVRSVTVVDG